MAQVRDRAGAGRSRRPLLWISSVLQLKEGTNAGRDILASLGRHRDRRRFAWGLRGGFRLRRGGGDNQRCVDGTNTQRAIPSRSRPPQAQIVAEFQRHIRTSRSNYQVSSGASDNADTSCLTAFAGRLPDLRLFQPEPCSWRAKYYQRRHNHSRREIDEGPRFGLCRRAGR